MLAGGAESWPLSALTGRRSPMLAPTPRGARHRTSSEGIAPRSLRPSCRLALWPFASWRSQRSTFKGSLVKFFLTEVEFLNSRCRELTGDGVGLVEVRVGQYPPGVGVGGRPIHQPLLRAEEFNAVPPGMKCDREGCHEASIPNARGGGLSFS